MNITDNAKQIVKEVIEAGNLKENDIFLVGCSTSEIIGDKIGTNSHPDIATDLINAIYEVLNEKGIYLAVQCCEHLNRAIVIEQKIAQIKGYETVNVVPQPKAGGSCATAAYKLFENPVMCEHIKADAGIDIGSVLIGMNLKEVAVPLRTSVDHIGKAYVVCARTRPKFIGGIRAIYDENLM